MDPNTSNHVAIHGLRTNEFPSIDIEPVFIQYLFSFVIILLINFVALYQFTVEMWKIYSEDNLESIIHDIYDKTILHTSLKYVFVSIICIVYFHDITSPPVQIVRIFWLYCLVIVFMKFDVKEILWPAVGFICGLIVIAWIWIALYAQLPAFKLILIETLVIVYFGANQSFQITKILNVYHKEKKSRAQLSLQTLLQKNSLQKNRNDYDSLAMNVELDEHIIVHLQNRRSFCLVFGTVLLVNLILFLDLEAGKELLGEIILSVVLDLLPLYVVYWYLRKTGKEKQETNKRLSKMSESSFQQSTNKRMSKIVIEMVNLKS